MNIREKEEEPVERAPKSDEHSWREEIVVLRKENEMLRERLEVTERLAGQYWDLINKLMNANRTLQLK